jgi:hypothetical protein
VGVISTDIPGPEYQPLVEALRVAADICEHPGERPRDPSLGNVVGFGRYVLARWIANVQAFIVLRNARFFTDAYGIARIGSELAIMAEWAASGGPGKKFNTPEERVRALESDGRYRTRVWFNEMAKHLPAPLYDASTKEGRTLVAARKPGLPKIEQMANCSITTQQLYAFAYRGESGSVHSSATVLITHGEGRPPLPEENMLHNVLATAMVIFGAFAELSNDDRARKMTAHLQNTVRVHADRHRRP